MSDNRSASVLDSEGLEATFASATTTGVIEAPAGLDPQGDAGWRPTRLMNRTFLLIWLGQAVSALGVQIFTISMVFWITDETGSATLLGLLQMLSALPAVVLGPIAGALADRYSRRKIMIAADIASGIAVFCLVAVVLSTGGAVQPTLIALFVVSILVNLIATFFQPALFSLLPDIVPHGDIARANTLAQVAYQLVTFAGMGLGGWLYRKIGYTIIFAVNVCTYLISGGSVSFAQEPRRAAPAVKLAWKQQLGRVRDDIVEGFRYAWSRKGLRQLVLLSAVTTFFSMPIFVMLTFYVKEVLHAEEDWYGFISAAYGIGNLIGLGVSGVVPPSGKLRGRLFIVSALVQALGFAALGLIRTPIVATGVALLGGVLSGFATLSVTLLVQVTTESTIRGRVFGLLASLSASVAPISMGLTGIITDLLDRNFPLLYMASGLLMTMASLVIVSNRHFRSFVTEEHEAPMDASLGGRAQPQPGD